MILYSYSIKLNNVILYFSRIPTTFPEIDSKVKMVKFIWKSPNKPKLILGNCPEPGFSKKCSN